MSVVLVLLAVSAAGQPLEVVGVNVVNHVRAGQWRWSDPLGGALGARVQMYVRNSSSDPRNTVTVNTLSFDGSFPLHHILHGKWSWSDTPNEWPQSERDIPPGALSVWSFNAVEKTWQDDAPVEIRAVDWGRSTPDRLQATFRASEVAIRSVTFGGEDVHPTRVYIHVRNESPAPIALQGLRLWLPADNASNRALYATPHGETISFLSADGTIPANDQGILMAKTDPLPLTYGAIEVTVKNGEGAVESLWAHLRIRREVFDIGGGWIDGTASDGRSVLTHEPYLKLLKRLHISAAHIGEVPGYNDAIGTNSLYDRYPIKRTGALNPTEQFDSPEMITHVHAADFLGEPQVPFGGMLPQSVLTAFRPYRSSGVPTSVTHSDERTLRYYAGLSDYPNCDAYRVNAPSADSWSLYEWEGGPIGWGAPLETIGELCRVVAELSQPMPTAAWSQGPHDGWGSYGGRIRLSPTPDELIVQAYHVLSTRVTSFYWFNLSLPALLTYPDTLEPMMRLGREMRMLEHFYLTGAAYHYARHLNAAGEPDWDLASIVSPDGAVLFALDLEYEPDRDARVFRFKEARSATLSFQLPGWLRPPADVFQVTADGTYEVEYEVTGDGVQVSDTLHKAGVYIAAATEETRRFINRRLEKIRAQEAELDFDHTSDSDMEALVAIP